MRSNMLLIGVMAGFSGGVGLEVLAKKTAMSKYKVRKMLKELVSMNFVDRRANLFSVNSFGKQLTEVDNAAWMDTLMEGK